MTAGKKIYFASDFHLGLEVDTDPLLREKHVVKWLRSVAGDAAAIYLVGDIFDFWWEYKSVVPRGFTRFLGTISELTDSGLEIHFFTGNHDMWISDYLSRECGMVLHTEALYAELLGKKFYIAHGEGLGTRDTSYKILLWIFRNRLLRKLYSSIHPRIGLAIAHRWTKESRLAKHYASEFINPDNESLVRHAKKVLESKEVDYFVFGHRHIALDYEMATRGPRIFFLGNWFSAPAYMSWDGDQALLHEFNYQ